MSLRITHACDGCTACKRQCPTSAIAGEAHVVHTIDPVLCIECGVCGAICPCAAVLDAHGAVVKRISRDLRPRPVVDMDLCNGCDLCIAICPFDCRALVGSKYDGVAYLSAPLRCVACGECATICIKAAITMTPMDLRHYDPEAEAERLRVALEIPNL